MKDIETRYFPATELRVNTHEGRTPTLVGYAAVFNSLSEPMFDQRIGEFREIIAPGAISQAVLDRCDVRCLVDHDCSKITGRTKSGTLRLSLDSKGLAIENDPSDTTSGRDITVSIQRGDIDQMSFGFRGAVATCAVDETGMIVRTITQINELVDVSYVTYPAYPDTTVAVRSILEWKAENAPEVNPRNRALVLSKMIELNLI